jgi:hypothetical protein
VFGHWPAHKTLEGYEDRLLEICHARGMAVEINTRFLYRDNADDQKKKFLEANARLIQKAFKRGVGIAIGSDAHSPKDQGNGFDRVLRLLDDAGVNEIVFPVGGRLARVALRATREHLEAQAKSRETSTPGSSITGYGRAELGLPEEAEPVGGRREGPRAPREAGPKKRAADATRSAKRPEPTAHTAKSTSRRSAESSTQSSKAKAARTPAKAAPAKAASAKTAAAKKAAPKAKAPVKSVKPAKPSKPAKKAPKAKPAAKPAARKPAVKKAPAKKTAAKSLAKSKKLAAKPAAKKQPKKITKSSSKGSAAKTKSAKRR